jgi:hypothetical protein
MRSTIDIFLTEEHVTSELALGGVHHEISHLVGRWAPAKVGARNFVGFRSGQLH